LAVRNIHRVVAERLASWQTGLSLAAVFLLTGLAIYVGRFLRFNSWDVLLPWRLLAKLFSQFDGFALQFTLLMAGVTLAIYGAFWLVTSWPASVQDSVLNKKRK
jgi:uncharacterized membrane protein